MDSSGKARKNSNGRDLFLSFTIIRNNCLGRREKGKIEIEIDTYRDGERERERSLASCDFAARLLRRNGGARRRERGDSVMHRNAFAGTRER